MTSMCNGATSRVEVIEVFGIGGDPLSRMLAVQ